MEDFFKKKEPIIIEGLTIIENAIDKEMHDKLWKEVNKEEWLTDLSRRTQHYGYKYNYKSRSLKSEDIAPPFPQWASDLCCHLMKEGLINDFPQQLIVNEYKDGQGISAHIDSKIFDNIIFSISLGSTCKMIFKKSIQPTTTTKTTTTTSEKAEVLKVEKQLAPRAFLLIKDEARFNWTHEIPKLKKGQHRISLTFRFVSKPPSPLLKSKLISNNKNNEIKTETTKTTTTTTTTKEKIETNIVDDDDD
ncbi:2-oxoglutarate and Fe-dependent oxygenase family protein [Dictyostelium discoideum AX4]|uniref:2-oxoglutarate and Fe-dependent oxygenase family protein n=1 Tax=Dictyostelium discoideum TaxID=44689 RepID=Q54BK8_DICDI|nr:2-oxoglutarate and Fe-dependent oxygenase family protein [Dictyostelium discoideum AX4]EAL60603.1 2-oxoglutarate and Fe-dependent oxygenase family protein [Dictyostelium discoideum AX4]|eukprot:XP_629021.1 2-oxoglutarate and Fe-dependent oxygenase family protein [Dictyostelium discoideum AX4]